MKKILTSIAALALVALAASCSKEQTFDSQGAETLVSFTVATPDLQTRAIADGTTVDKVACCVYDSNGNYIENTNISKTVDMTSGSATFEACLVTGQTYSFIFWAYNAAGAHYTLDAANKKITVKNYSGAANDESRDAFYYYKAPTKITGALNETITLTRPFAQLNFGVTAADVTNASNNGVTVTKSSLKLTGLATELNLVDGTVSGSLSADFTAAALPSEKLTVGSNTYDYVSMNYVLVGKTAKALTDAVLTIYKADGTAINSIDVPNVPLQGNYRTNVYGDLYTSTTSFTLSIAPAFTQSDYNVNRISIPAGGTGTYRLPATADDVVVNIEGACKDIALEYAQDAQDAQKPKNVTINGGSYAVDGLTYVNLSSSHVEVRGGTFTNVKSNTNNTTLVLSESTKITEKLEVAVGGVEIAGTVKDVEVKKDVSAEAKIVLAPTANITKVTTESSAPIVISKETEATATGAQPAQAQVASIVVNKPTDETGYVAPVIELQDGATIGENVVSGSAKEKVATIESSTETTASGEQQQVATVNAKDKATLEYALKNNRNVKLTAAITGNFTVPADAELTIDLNGFTITAATATAITVPATATLTVTDNSSSAAGTVSTGSGYAIDNSAGGKLTVEGVSIPNVYVASGDIRYYAADNAALIAAVGDATVTKVVLTKDIYIGTAVTVKNGRTVELDANGKTVTCKSASYFYGITVYGSLTVTGDGKFILNNKPRTACAIILLKKEKSADNPGNLVVENGYFECTNGCIEIGAGNAEIKKAFFKAKGGGACLAATGGVTNVHGMTFTCDSDDPDGPGCCWANGGVFNIYGGEFESVTLKSATEAGETLGVNYCLYDYEDAVKYGYTKGTINVYGGTFKDFNPASNYNNHSFLAEGYVSTKSTKSGIDYWTVTKAAGATK